MRMVQPLLYKAIVIESQSHTGLNNTLKTSIFGSGRFLKFLPITDDVELESELNIDGSRTGKEDVLYTLMYRCPNVKKNIEFR